MGLGLPDGGHLTHGYYVCVLASLSCYSFVPVPLHKQPSSYFDLLFSRYPPFHASSHKPPLP